MSIGLAAWRIRSGLLQGWKKGVFLTLTVLLFGLIVQGADLGGLMVYKYGVAVHNTSSETLTTEAPSAPNEEHHHHDHVHQ